MLWGGFNKINGEEYMSREKHLGVEIRGSLEDTEGVDLTWSRADPQTSRLVKTVEVWDPLGLERPVDMVFTRNAHNQWKVEVWAFKNGVSDPLFPHYGGVLISVLHIDHAQFISQNLSLSLNWNGWSDSDTSARENLTPLNLIHDQGEAEKIQENNHGRDTLGDCNLLELP